LPGNDFFGPGDRVTRNNSDPSSSSERGSNALLELTLLSANGDDAWSPSTLDWPPPHADTTASAMTERHPPMGGIFAGAFDMVLRRVIGGWVHFGVNLCL
jgi:hypothetical protein